MMDILAMMAEQAAAEAAAATAAEGAAGAAMASAPMAESMNTPNEFEMNMAPSVPMQSNPSFGQQIGNYASQTMDKQMQPAMDAYKVMVNPNSTMGDYGRAAFQYSANTSSQPETPMPQVPQGFNPYAAMTSNQAGGGIESILQNTNSGILPFFTGR
jgi:hypothetical protein